MHPAQLQKMCTVGPPRMQLMQSTPFAQPWKNPPLEVDNLYSTYRHVIKYNREILYWWKPLQYLGWNRRRRNHPSERERERERWRHNNMAARQAEFPCVFPTSYIDVPWEVFELWYEWFNCLMGCKASLCLATRGLVALREKLHYVTGPFGICPDI